MEKKEEQSFSGIPGAPGIVHGPLFTFYQGEVEVPRYSVPPERREEEIARFEQGLMETRRQISAIRAEVEEKIGEEEASIFDAHQLVLEDRALIEDTIQEVVETGFNIEFCFQEVANRYIEAFSQIDDDYIKERVSDIRDVAKRLLCNLLGCDHGNHGQSGIGQHVLVSQDLSPSETALLDLEEVMGIVTEMGSRTSHSVIMARSLNIPCVVGVHGLMDLADFGDEILIDGYKGQVFLNPSEATLERYGRLESEQQHIRERFEAEANLPSVTTDGINYPLLLNIEGVEDPDKLRASGANGIGLFRTENLFLASRDFPTEEEQFAVYKNLVEKLSPYPVTIRTLDLGGDKNPHRSLTGYQEANPFMGFRGIRFCLENTGLFKDQLRAILRASRFGPVNILYPMISSLDELKRANALLEEAAAGLEREQVPIGKAVRKGAMIEVPSAAVITDLLAAHCDFFSIGTNDLMQYLLAVDRVNDRIAYLYDANQPSVVRTLNFIFQQAKMRHVPVSVCGELAADPLFAPLLIGLGAQELSVSMGAFPRIKYLLRRISLHDAKHLAIRVLRCEETDQILGELEAFYEKAMGEAIETLKGF
jgi:phosphoenolpyruvate-protein phosphotransferase (PTS system enzyme I)